MGRHAAPRSGFARVRGFLAAAAFMTAALLAAGFAGTSGSYALWNDSTSIGGGTITSGTPGLSVSGFEDLDHVYELTALSTQAMVTVTNTGNTTLSDLSASPELIDDSSSPALLNAISTSFVPVGGGAAQSWSTWLSGVTLAPGASVQYLVTTSIPLLDLALYAAQSIDVEVVTAATAGTSWTVYAVNGFQQDVDIDLTPGEDSFNLTFEPHGGDHSVDAVWQNPPGTPTGVTYYVFVNGVQLSGSAGYYWPHFAISTSNIPSQFAPGPGATTTITVTVTTSTGTSTPIARGTLWLTGQAGGDFTIHVTSPTRAPAPAPASGRPAEATPESTAPEPGPGPEPESGSAEPELAGPDTAAKPEPEPPLEASEPVTPDTEGRGTP
jgi:hypothetical protein